MDKIKKVSVSNDGYVEETETKAIAKLLDNVNLQAFPESIELARCLTRGVDAWLTGDEEQEGKYLLEADAMAEKYYAEHYDDLIILLTNFVQVLATSDDCNHTAFSYI